MGQLVITQAGQEYGYYQSCFLARKHLENNKPSPSKHITGKRQAVTMEIHFLTMHEAHAVTYKFLSLTLAYNEANSVPSSGLCRCRDMFKMKIDD